MVPHEGEKGLAVLAQVGVDELSRPLEQGGLGGEASDDLRAFDRVGFVPFVVASGVSSVASLVLLATMTDAAGLLLAAPLMAGGYGVMCSVCQSTAVRAVGPEHVGLANSTYYMGFDVGMTLGPVIGGALFGAVDLAWFFPVLALAAPAAVAVALLSRRAASRPRGGLSRVPRRGAGRDRVAGRRNNEM